MNSTGTRKQKMKRARTDMSSIQNRVSDALLGALADLEALSPPRSVNIPSMSRVERPDRRRRYRKTSSIAPATEILQPTVT